MLIMTNKQYENDKMEFFKNNGGLLDIVTSNMENNVYYKTYFAKNNKTWYERIETYHVITKKIWDDKYHLWFDYTATTTVIEYWNDTDATTKIYYDGNY